jgi:hypothetical protein
MPKWKWALIVLGCLVGVGALARAYACVALLSQAVLDARYALPPSTVRAAATAEAIARGADLTMVTACISYHGADLTGRMLSVSGSVVYAPNLKVRPGGA